MKTTLSGDNAAIDELYTEGVVFYDPNKGAYRGRDEIDCIAAAIKGDSSGLQLSANCGARGEGQWGEGPDKWRQSGRPGR